MIKVQYHGDWADSIGVLKRGQKPLKESTLRRYGSKGVSALRQATPKRTGKTAESWEYDVEMGHGGALYFDNRNIHKGKTRGMANVALLIQFGHKTPTGGYVRGIDYINPAINPILANLSDDTWSYVIGKRMGQK